MRYINRLFTYLLTYLLNIDSCSFRSTSKNLPGIHPVPLLHQRHYHQYQITDASLCRRRLDHFRPILSVSDHHILQNDLHVHTLEQWANTWDMRFNPCKCYILSMKRAGVKSAIYFYTLCGQVLESVTNNPYLGVISTDDFSFSTHVRQVCAKASRTLDFLRRNLRNC